MVNPMKRNFIEPFLLSNMFALGLARSTALTWWAAVNFVFVILWLSVYSGMMPRLNGADLFNLVVVFNVISLPNALLLKGAQYSPRAAFAGSKVYLWLTRGVCGWCWWILSVGVLVALVCNTASMWMSTEEIGVYNLFVLLLMALVGMAFLSLWQSAKVLYCWWEIGIYAHTSGFVVPNPERARKTLFLVPRPIPFMALVVILLMVVLSAMLNGESQVLPSFVLSSVILMTYCLGVWVFSERLFKSVAINLSLICERTMLARELEQRKGAAEVLPHG